MGSEVVKRHARVCWGSVSLFVCVCIPYVHVSMPALLLIRAHPSSHASLHNSLHVYVYHRLSTGEHILLLQRQPSHSGGGNVTGEDNVKNGISRTGSVISPSLSLSFCLSFFLSQARPGSLVVTERRIVVCWWWCDGMYGCMCGCARVISFV